MKSNALIFIFVAITATGCLNPNNPTPVPQPSPSPTGTISPSPSPTPTPTPTYGTDEYMGPQMTTQSEYRLAAAMDSDVLAGAATEPWAMVYRPVNMGTAPHPVVMVLHGNHMTCGVGGDGMPWEEKNCRYTLSGQCDSGHSVIPNHLGYGYLAHRLASWGYVVVSINANLGIGCGNPASGDSGLILARGRLILRHLSLLSQWNRIDETTPSSLGVNLKGQLDLSQVGLLGHSRGGEGVRAAYALYNEIGSHWRTDIGEPVTFRGVFEIAPTDGQSSMIINPKGVAWNVLLPMCDGDVRRHDGMKPFDRVLAATDEAPALPKSMFAVWGANHNFYNTYWQKSDSTGCAGANPLWRTSDTSSGDQQQTAVAAVIPFFRAHVGAQADRSLAAVFNPSNAVPSPLAQITRIDRAYVESPNQSKVSRVETFQASSGRGSLGQAHEIQNVTVTHAAVPEHDAILQAANVTWNGPGAAVYFQNNWAAAGAGLDLTNVATLDFRVSRNVDQALNPASFTDFDVQLVKPDGTLGGAVKLSNYFGLVGPVGIDGGLHITLPTVRIPLADLGGLTSARGVRFTFNSTASGNIFVSDIDLSMRTGSGVIIGKVPPVERVEPLQIFLSATASLTSAAKAFDILSRGPASLAASSSNQIVRIDSIADGSSAYEIEVQSAEGFPVRDALPVLRLNGREIAPGYFSTTGDLHTMTFRVTPAQLQFLPNEFEMEMGHREDPRGPTKAFGTVSKASFR